MATPSPAAQLLTSNKIEAHRDVNIHHIVNNSAGFPTRDPMMILQEHVAIGALYDSDERSIDPPKCHPNTRIAVLDRIEHWASDVSNEANPIFWLSGPAGAGKSAIAQSLVERWKERGINVVAFFFWRTASERNHKTRLVPTIALQLLRLFPSIKPSIEAAVTTIGFFKMSLPHQLHRLVVEPLCSITRGQSPVVIVVDGLDECCADLPKVKDFPGQDFESQQREILEALASTCSKLTWVRLLIVSRPEKQIRESFGAGFLKERSHLLSLKDVSDSENDIRLFLECNFYEIRQQYGIGVCWPTEAQLSELICKSSGQFIYPSVAIRYIRRSRTNPVQSLKTVLELQSGSVDNPLAELDMLYTLVLKSVAPRSLPVVKNILGYILLLTGSGLELPRIFSSNPGPCSPLMFENLLFLSEGEVMFHLTDLHSVLDIPASMNHGIKVIHATLSEFLQDKFRCGDFFMSRNQITDNYTLLAFRHVRKAFFDDEGEVYSLNVFILSGLWLESCSPSRTLAVYVWSLIQTEIGDCLFRVPHGDMAADPFPLLNKELSTLLTSRIRRQFRVGTAIRCIIRYLQKCNIPQIEPAWWRRLKVRLRLKAALSKFSEVG